MRFRKNMFTLLAFLVVLGACAWATQFSENVEELGPAESEAEETGRVLGEGAGYGLIACVTIPFFAVFSLLAWRNAVGIRTEQRHQEQIEAMRQARYE
jgi:hypothetical protein